MGYFSVIRTMFTLKQLINTSGYKKEYLIKRSQINRRKFYMAIKNPSLLNIDEIGRLASALRIDFKSLQDIINGQTSGHDHRQP